MKATSVEKVLYCPRIRAVTCTSRFDVVLTLTYKYTSEYINIHKSHTEISASFIPRGVSQKFSHCTYWSYFPLRQNMHNGRDAHFICVNALITIKCYCYQNVSVSFFDCIGSYNFIKEDYINLKLAATSVSICRRKSVTGLKSVS